MEDISEVDEREWLVPMQSRTEIIGNKKVDYSLLGALMLESKRNPVLIEEKSTRYIYQNQIQGENLKTFCNTYGLTVRTTIRNVQVLKKLEVRLIEIFTVNKDYGRQEVVYRIHFADKDNKYFVRVPSSVLRDLVTSYKSSVIKLFCHMLYLLWDKDGGKYVQRWIPLSYLGELLGCNSDTAGRHMKALVKAGCIKMFKEWDSDESSDKGNTITKNFYSIAPEIIELVSVLCSIENK